MSTLWDAGHKRVNSIRNYIIVIDINCQGVTAVEYYVVPYEQTDSMFVFYPVRCLVMFSGTCLAL